MSIEYRELGRTGIKVSAIGVGAWQLGGPLILDGKTAGHPELGREFCIQLIRQCGELGINFIDTAEQYGAGESERRVGEAIAGRREQWVVGSKFGHTVGPNGQAIPDATPKRLPLSLAGSLRRLKTDYIDVYVYHVAPKQEEAEEVARFLESAKQKGQVRAAGISTNNLGHLNLLLALGCLDVVQFNRSMMDMGEALTAFLQEHLIGGVVRGAFAGGRLSGRYFSNAAVFPADDIRSHWINPQTASADFFRFKVFQEMVTPQRSMIQLALRYLLDQSTTHTIIPGGKSLEDYKQALGALKIPRLTEAERERIGELRTQILQQKIG